MGGANDMQSGKNGSRSLNTPHTPTPIAHLSPLPLLLLLLLVYSALNKDIKIQINTPQNGCSDVGMFLCDATTVRHYSRVCVCVGVWCCLRRDRLE